MIAWIDLEATGLVAASHAVLEIAAIVTDDRLREVGRFHRVIHWDDAPVFAQLGPDSTDAQIDEVTATMDIDRVVVGLHARNGLWAEAAVSQHVLADVDAQLSDFLAQLSIEPDGQRAQLAGSSIWLDRSFMAVHLPKALEQLHYRCVDVTSLNEVARRFWPRIYAGRPAKRDVHRALPDIEDSLALCRYYAYRVEMQHSEVTWELMGDEADLQARGAAADFLQVAKNHVTNRKAIAAVFIHALRDALDELSPDERAVWGALAISEISRSERPPVALAKRRQ